MNEEVCYQLEAPLKRPPKDTSPKAKTYVGIGLSRTKSIGKLMAFVFLNDLATKYESLYVITIDEVTGLPVNRTPFLKFIHTYYNKP